MRYEDIHLSDKTLRQEFIECIRTNNWQGAFAVLENENLTNKKNEAAVYNDICNELVSLQNNSDPDFKSDRIKVTSVEPALQSGQVFFKEE